MSKFYYLYEIFINNPESSLNNHYYYGKHITQDLKKDYYYGSGKLIKSYMNKWGTYGLIKSILEFYSDEESLNQAEYDLIYAKKEELGELCLNLNEGGHGSFTYINSTRTPEQRHNNALIGGIGNKKRLEDPEENAKWKEQCSLMHQRRTPEEKMEIYTKVSNSLIKYYQNATASELAERNKKNKESNIKSSKIWRDKFFSLFGRTPESFRKLGKQKASLDLYKRIKNLPMEEQQYEIARFMESIIE